ncbi:MAG: helix-turn-helix domain-containing protein [Desulfobacteraceae bacterium]|nr:MAG: helix-turn-helix domain-containing protein [Desulfobacteraceae bacterium]
MPKSLVSNLREEKLLLRMLGSFREAMKLEVYLFPMTNREGVRSFKEMGHPYCRAIRSCPRGEYNCLRDINRAINLSEKTGEPYIFQCHADMIEFTAAFKARDGNAAAFVCGPMLLRPLNTQVRQGIVDGTKNLDPEQSRALASYIDSIPIYSERRVQAAADLLFLIATYFSKIDLLTLHQQHEISFQQSLLAEGLVLRKISELDEEEPSPQPPSPKRDIFKENELIDLIKIGDRKRAKALVDEILGTALFRSHEHIGILKARALEIIFVIARAAVEAGANLEEILGFKYQYVQNLSKDDSQQTLYHFLMKAFDQLFECIYQNRNIQHTAIFAKAKEFIWKNHNQEISLKKLAEAVGINPYYLSHLFREEMGTSFVEYLTSVRVSIAKNLLKQTTMSTMEICLAVGYMDPSHFAKVFKKQEKVSPSGYRKKLAEAEITGS